MGLRTKRVYDAAEPGDGVRLLTMRIWPRGIAKDRVTEWEKELGPSRELLGAYREEQISWPEFAKRYREEMRAKPELLATWAERAREEDVTILCGCQDESHCHRTLLRELLERAIARRNER